MAASFGDALRPAIAGENAGGDQSLDQCFGARFIAFDEIADAALQASGARAPAGLGADDPTPQFAPFLARQAHRKGAVGGIQQMVALVEDIAGRHGCIVEPAERGLCHHQRVVGDDDARLPRLADVLFDETAAKMRAGRMDALAAPIGEPIDPAAPDEFGEPAREIARHQVAGPASRRSTGRSARDAGRPSRPAHRGVAPRPRNSAGRENSPAPCGSRRGGVCTGIGVEPVEFAGDLGLQVAGIGRNPHRAPVLLGPKAGGAI